MKPSEHLEQAKTLLQNGWCKGHFCIKDGDGIKNAAQVTVDADAYCMEGALIATGATLDSERFYECGAYLAAVANGIDHHYDIVSWNDEHTKTDVLDAFDHAIKLAKEDEALDG